MEVTMMSVMIRSPFRSFSIRFLFRGDQSDHDGCGGDDDSGNDEFHFSFSSLFCDLAAGSDQGNDNSGGSKDGSNYDSGHDFVPLSFLFFRGFSVPRRHPYNTTTRTKIVQVVIFNALFVIFDTGFFQEAAIHIAGLTAPGTSTFRRRHGLPRPSEQWRTNRCLNRESAASTMCCLSLHSEKRRG